ncbi:unnamed protein product [Arctia plantaginis]|uniref:Helicase ATP-binding domain-containing protein n=1 Tax=Arctia plantaginis TaxID=874455 RepID=A0A8S1AKV9_ARCPL|nr:unnamed protein product [Arctia plantaginis]
MASEQSEQFSYEIEGINVDLPVRPYDVQKEIMSKAIKTFQDSTNCVIESPTGTGKTLALLCSAIAWQKKYTKFETQDNKRTKISERHPTIYFASRTNEQVNSAYNEFKRTSYFKDTSRSILSSREISCFKELDSRQANSKDEMCLKYKNSCNYYYNYEQLLDMGKCMLDLEDLGQVARKRGACAYFGAIELAKNADIVFCTQNYIIDPKIRQKLQINLKDAIILLDDAHDVENKCRQSASVDFTSDDINAAIDDLADSGEAYQELVSMLRTWYDWATEQQTLRAHRLLLQLRNGHQLSQDYYKELRSAASRRVIRYKSLLLVEKVITVVDYLREDTFSSNFILKVVDSKNNTKVKMECMMPSIVMKKLIDEMPRCVVLSSGAFAMDINHLRAELGPYFQNHYPFTDVVQDNRVWVGAIDTTPRLMITNINKNPDTVKKLGEIILGVCKVTPHVVLCFMPSYAFLRSMKNHWEEPSQLLADMKELKHVIWEDQNTTADGREFENYVGGSDVLLFAVYRGKYADMDFKDKPARAVICVGEPMPNTSDVQEKMDFNNRNISKGLLDKENWLQAQIFRALNQAAGRCIRHKDDWGAVLLVNCELSHPKLAPWMKRSVNRNEQTVWASRLEDFMNRMAITD